MSNTTPVVLDVEASGFGAGSYPIEVGLALPDGSTFCSLVRPQPAWTHWDAAAEAVHGISRDTLERHGRPVAEVAHALNEHLHGATAYSDAWGNDSAWLALLFEEAGVAPGFRLESLRALLSDRDLAHWQAARARALFELGQQRHRASADALVVQHALLATWRASGRLAALRPEAAAEAPARRAISLTWLVGQPCTRVHRRDSGGFGFEFGAARLWVEGTWRVLGRDGVMLGRGDHERLFSGGGGLDSALVAATLLIGPPVKYATAHPVTGDLEIVFASGYLLQVWTDGASSEPWALVDGDGRGWAAQAGGPVMATGTPRAQ